MRADSHGRLRRLLPSYLPSFLVSTALPPSSYLSLGLAIVFLSSHQGLLCFFSLPIILPCHPALSGLSTSFSPCNTVLVIKLEPTTWKHNHLIQYEAGWKLYAQREMTAGLVAVCLSSPVSVGCLGSTPLDPLGHLARLPSLSALFLHESFCCCR